MYYPVVADLDEPNEELGECAKGCVYWVTTRGRERADLLPSHVRALRAGGVPVKVIDSDNYRSCRGKTGTFFVDADLYDRRELREVLVPTILIGGAVIPVPVADAEREDEIEDDAALWGVSRDGGEVETCVAGYNDGDRGRIALHFVSDDDAGWSGDTYDELLWVRRMRPDPEGEPGAAIRIKVTRDHAAEQAFRNG